jgi:hypothetical protein
MSNLAKQNFKINKLLFKIKWVIFLIITKKATNKLMAFINILFWITIPILNQHSLHEQHQLI